MMHLTIITIINTIQEIFLKNIAQTSNKITNKATIIKWEPNKLKIIQKRDRLLMTITPIKTNK